ncbi:hypothetical protein Sjap_022055 [Stephania japonica]|uniref:Uncharacterized protein n=1 Tax=Stephania japonica TaxID=461633 RepID=A0AAP0ETV0_9MAGN
MASRGVEAELAMAEAMAEIGDANRVGIVNTKALRSVLCHQIKSRCPEGVPLDIVLIHPSMIDMLDSAAVDAIKCRHFDEEMVDGGANIDDEEMVDGDANIDDEEMVDANIGD